MKPQQLGAIFWRCWEISKLWHDISWKLLRVEVKLSCRCPLRTR